MIIATEKKGKPGGTYPLYVSNKFDLKQPLYGSFISQLLQVLEQRFIEADFNVEQLAKALMICPRTLHRRAMLVTGLNASRIIRSYRLHKAKELLQRGRLVCDAAYATGFENLSYFTRCFKSEFQVCPSRYLESEDSLIGFPESTFRQGI